MPLSETGRLQLAQRAQEIRALVDQGLKPLEKAANDGKEFYSVGNLAAFDIGRQIYAALDTGDQESAAGRQLLGSLLQLARGCHGFHQEEKVRAFRLARRSAATAVAHLSLGAAAQQNALAIRIEQELIPKISGLIAANEKRGHRNRFERFGSRP